MGQAGGTKRAAMETGRMPVLLSSSPSFARLERIREKDYIAVLNMSICILQKKNDRDRGTEGAEKALL
jgi:hypothetical protein